MSPTDQADTIVAPGTEPTVTTGDSDERSSSKEAIATRAYEIHLSNDGGSDVENWLRAERELSDDA